VVKRQVFDLRRVLGFVDKLFGDELHAKRLLSLANATLGLLSSGTMRVHAIGQGLAEAQGRVTKHAIKQVDRLLSNQGLDVGASFAYWVTHAIGGRPQIIVTLDWTEFDADGHASGYRYRMSVLSLRPNPVFHILAVSLYQVVYRWD
jgi:hypothetical protein